MKEAEMEGGTGINIIVCIKQVIAGDQVKIDPRTHTLIRSAEFSYINPFDLFALDMAVQLRKEYSGSITAITMGPQISEEVLREALAIGADRAVLLSDPRFAASDTLATSYVLGAGIRKIGKFDLVLCGMRTTDSDTSQVGPQLAEELDLPHVTAVEKLQVKKNLLHIERLSDGFREVLRTARACPLNHLPEGNGAPSQLDRNPRCLHPHFDRMLESGGSEDRSHQGRGIRFRDLGRGIDSDRTAKIMCFYSRRFPTAGQVAFTKID